MSDTRKSFEQALTKQIRSLHELFKVFARNDAGAYLREEIENLWQGWQLHETYLSEHTADVDARMAIPKCSKCGAELQSYVGCPVCNLPSYP